MSKLLYSISRGIKKVFCPSAIKNTTMGYGSFASEGSLVVDCSFGRHSYVGQYTSIHSASVGNFTSISSFCEIGAGMHPINFVSTSPFFYKVSQKNGHSFPNEFYETVIGNDVWIGSHVLVKSGIRISDGAIIGMGSIVTHDVGPYEIWAGNPARIIRKRFDDETIDQLLSIQWWNWNDEILKKRSVSFADASTFVQMWINKNEDG